MQQIKVMTYSRKKNNDCYDWSNFTFTNKATFTAVVNLNGKRKQLTITSKDKKYFSRFGKEDLRIKTIKKLISKHETYWGIFPNWTTDNPDITIKTEVKKFKHYMNNKNWSVKFHNITLN
jgi:hypothetical protein